MNTTTKTWFIRFTMVGLVLLFGLLLAACGEEEYAESPDGEQTSVEQPPASPIVGTWQDDSGTYTYTEDGKLLQNGEDSGATYSYQDDKLIENYTDGSTRTYMVQFDGNSMTQVAEDDGSSFTLQRVDDGSTASEPTAPAEGENPPVAGSADLGFRPEVNGFSFANYGSDQPVTNLTPAEVRRMFGDQVCASLQGDTCVLIPPAEQWMEQNNSGMSGGHCEGFAALSLLMYSGQVDPNQFGGATASELALDGNELLQREIAYWFVTQATQPAQGAIIKGTPAEIVSALQSAYAAGSNSNETYAVGIYKADGSEGHAVTAYGVEDQGNLID